MSAGYLGQHPVQSRVSGPDQVTQDFIPSSLESLQERRVYSVCGQPVPILESPHGENFFPYIQFKFMSVLSCPPTGHHSEETCSFFLMTSS